MDQELEAELKRITSKPASELTEYEAGFLRARKDYLGRRTREKFADVLAGKTTTEEEKTTEEPVVEENKFPGDNKEDDDGAIE